MGKTKDILKLSEDEGAIVVAHKSMEVGKDYSISYKGENYTFRKTPEGKVEIYVMETDFVESGSQVGRKGIRR